MNNGMNFPIPKDLRFYGEPFKEFTLSLKERFEHGDKQTLPKSSWPT